MATVVAGGPDELLARSGVELLEYFSKSEPSALKYALLVTSASRCESRGAEARRGATLCMHGPCILC